MKPNSLIRIFLCVVSFTLITPLALTSQALIPHLPSEFQTTQPKSAGVQSQAVEERVEEFRRQMLRLLTVIPALAPNKPEIESQSAKLQQDFGKLTTEQMKIMADAIDIPAFSRNIDRITDFTSQNPLHFIARQKIESLNPGDHPLDPPDYSNECGMTPSDTKSGLALLSSINLLEGIIATIEAGCESTPEILNVSICNLNGGFKIIKAALELFKGQFEFCDGDINGVETLAALKDIEHIHDDLLNSVSKDNANKDAIITNNLTNTNNITKAISDSETNVIKNSNQNTQTILGEIAKFRAENLRLQIELNLLQGPRYNLASFQMPESVGGHLGLVRTIVADTIKMQRQAGLTGALLDQAEKELAIGDQLVTAKGYKDAYAHFRLAYLNVAIIPQNQQP